MAVTLVLAVTSPNLAHSPRPIFYLFQLKPEGPPKPDCVEQVVEDQIWAEW